MKPTTSAVSTRPRVDAPREQIGGEVAEYDGEGQQHNDGARDRLVAPLNGGQQQLPETGDGEHLLDDDAAREQVGDRHGEEGQDRHERVFQHMAVENTAARASAAHGGADVVALCLV